MKKLILTIIILLTLSSTAFAKIEFEYKENGSVNYKSTKKLMKLSTNEWFEFVKNIERDNTQSYFIRFIASSFGGTTTDADVLIDGNKTVAKLVVIPYNKYSKPKTMSTRIEDWYVFYDLSPQTVEQLIACKKDLSFVFYPDNKNPIVFKVGEENMKEIQKIITLNYDNWQAVKSGKIEIDNHDD